MPKVLQMPKPAKKQKPQVQLTVPHAPVRMMPDAEEETSGRAIENWVALGDAALGNPAAPERKKA